MTQLDFTTYAQQLAQRNGRQTMLPVIEKELLHYEILRAAQEADLLSTLVFQGGTCLRLCYGASRYSEDLDFAGGANFDAAQLEHLKTCIERALPEKYLVKTTVKEPNDSDSFIKKWRIRVDTAPERPDLPSQKISLEVTSIPAYTRRARMLQLNYEGLPSSYEDTVLFAESLEEILADKLESFPCSSHIRYRDIWDMQWLMRRPNIDLQSAYELRKQKEGDYAETKKFLQGLTRVTEQLETIVEGEEFKSQMKRFLPLDQFEKTVARKEFRCALLDNVKELYAPILAQR
ncbi:MAG: nucleotidyl transferase AbiEii/AbiGii toxin family protein [Raoultibacter sp.]